MENNINNTNGRTGERIAANYLQKNNYEILAMNYSNISGYKIGEIDIIARDNHRKEIVFVEVKTRDYLRYGNTLPEENISIRKLQKIAKIAAIYLKKMRCEDAPHRFDAVSVWLNHQTKRAIIKHLPNIFL